MGSTTPFPYRKGQLLTTDATIALLLTLFILYVGFSVYSGMAVRAHETQEREALLSRTLSIADYLMKEGLVHKDNSGFGVPTAHSHLLERAKLDSLDNSTLAEKLGLQELCVELVSTNEAPQCTNNLVCIRRPAIIYETKEVGYLAVCAG